MTVALGSRAVAIGTGCAPRSEADRFLVYDVLSKFELGANTQAAGWLTYASDATIAVHESDLNYEVQALLATPPAPVRVYIRHRIYGETLYADDGQEVGYRGKQFKNGAELTAEWLEADDDYFQKHKERVYHIQLLAPDGRGQIIVYEYTLHKDGTDYLFVKKPIDSEAVPLASEVTAGDNVALRAAGAIFDPSDISLETLRRQDRWEGVDKVSEGTLAAFNQALKAAIDAGEA